MTIVKDVIVLWIVHMAINHANHLITKVLKVLKNASSNFVQILLLGKLFRWLSEPVLNETIFCLY